MKKSVVYTRTGDNGTTSLVGGTRIAKDDPRLEAYGTVDELNSHIGLVHSMTSDPFVAETLLGIQHRLFDLGAYLACDPDGEFQLPPGVTAETIATLEAAIDRLDEQMTVNDRFVLPGGSVESAQAHVARTVARRAERRIITLASMAPVDQIVVKYVNRLSDFLFVLARFNNVSRNIDEIFWEKDC